VLKLNEHVRVDILYGKKVPLNLQPAVGADVQAVAYEGVACRDHGCRHDGEGGNLAEFVADPVDKFAKFQKHMHIDQSFFVGSFSS